MEAKSAASEVRQRRKLIRDGLCANRQKRELTTRPLSAGPTVVDDAEPLVGHPGHALGGGRIEIGEHHQIVAAGKSAIQNCVYAAGATGNTESCR